MLELRAIVTIAGKTIKRVIRAEIDLDQEEIFNSAKLSLPLFLQSSVKISDPVSIRLGYASTGVYEEFTGYIDKISPEEDLVLHCLDESYTILSRSVNKIYKKRSPANLVKELFPGAVTIQSGEAEAEFDYRDMSLAEVVSDLKARANLNFFYVYSVPHFVKKHYQNPNGQIYKFDFSKDLIESKLTFKPGRPGAVLVISQSDQRTVTARKGEGEIVYRKRSNHLSPTQARDLARTIFEERNYRGFEGSFISFGYPFVQFGDLVNITDQVNPEREGIFVVTKVRVTYGDDGYRREIYPGRKI